jgi:nucleotide-binding universal stress UspA family protein
MDISVNTIILAVGPDDEDRVERLASVALQLAHPNDARVILTHVFGSEEFERLTDELNFSNATAEDIDNLVARHDTLNRLETMLADEGVSCSRKGIVENISEGIISVAEEMDADRVIISGGAHSPVGKAVFGSTAQSVLIGASCPVTYVRSTASD